MGSALQLRRWQATMLRITVHDAPEALTFQVEGRLVGEWARELERCWENTANIRENRSSIIDLTGILFIDAEGRSILTKLCHEGALFRTAGPLNDSIVSEISAKSKRKILGALGSAALVLAIAISPAHANEHRGVALYRYNQARADAK
jgi:hypothetical protein